MPKDFTEADFAEPGREFSESDFDTSPAEPAGSSLPVPPPGFLSRMNAAGQQAAEMTQGAAQAFLNPFPALERLNQAGVDVLSKFGVYPKGTQGYKPFTTPLISSEQAKDIYKESIAAPLGLSTAPDEGVLGQIEQGTGQFAANTVSGLSEPQALIPMALGVPPVQRAMGVTAAEAPILSDVIGKSFQFPMIAGIPESAQAIQQAQTPEDVVTATLGLGGNIALPFLIEKGHADASRIRENEGQIQRQRDVARSRQNQGGENLEQPAPGESGGTAQGGQPAASEKGQARALLDQEIADLENDPNITGEKVVGMNKDGSLIREPQIIDQGKKQRLEQLRARRKALDEGIATEGFLQGAEKVNDEADLDAAERQAIDEAERLGSKAEVLDESQINDPNAPFAGGANFTMWATGEGVKINRANFRAMLQSIPKAQWPKAIAQHILEEHIHRHVSNLDAREYLGTLSGIERAINRKAYTGKWTAKGLNKMRAKQGLGPIEFNARDLGHEAIRRRYQKLATGSTSEISLLAGREKWTLQSLEKLDDVVRKMRESFRENGTEASQAGKALFAKLEENLKAAKAVASGEAVGSYTQENREDRQKYDEMVARYKAAPLQEKFAMQGQMEALKNKYGGMPPPEEPVAGSLFKNPAKPTADELLDVDPADMKEWQKQIKYGPDDPAKFAQGMSAEDISKLDAESKRLRADAAAQIEKMSQAGELDQESMSKAMLTSLKSQTLREIVEDSKIVGSYAKQKKFSEFGEKYEALQEKAFGLYTQLHRSGLWDQVDNGNIKAKVAGKSVYDSLPASAKAQVDSWEALGNELGELQKHPDFKAWEKLSGRFEGEGHPENIGPGVGPGSYSKGHPGQKAADDVGARFDGEMDAGAGGKIWNFTAYGKDGKESTSFAVNAGASRAEVRSAYEAARQRYEGDPNQPRPIPETPPGSYANRNKSTFPFVGEEMKKQGKEYDDAVKVSIYLTDNLPEHQYEMADADPRILNLELKPEEVDALPQPLKQLYETNVKLEQMDADPRMQAFNKMRQQGGSGFPHVGPGVGPGSYAKQQPGGAFEKYTDEDIGTSGWKGLNAPKMSEQQREWFREHAGEKNSFIDDDGSEVIQYITAKGLEVQVVPEGWQEGDPFGTALTHHNGDIDRMLLQGPHKELNVQAARELMQLYKQGIPEASEQSFPGSLYKGELPLEPGGKGEERASAEEMGAKMLTAKDFDAASAEHFAGEAARIRSETGAGKKTKPPSFKDYSKAIQSKFGPIQPGALREKYEKALYDYMLQAPAEDIKALAKSTGVKSFTIAEPPLKHLTLQQEGENAAARALVREETKGQTRRQQYRNQVIGRITEKLLKKAAPEEIPPSINSVSPEDLREAKGQENEEPNFFDVTASDLKSPTALAQRLTDASRRSGRDPVTLTKRLTALLDKTTGRVYVVSTYPKSARFKTDPTTGRQVVAEAGAAMLFDPAVGRLKAHRDLGDMLKRSRPIASMLLDEPTQNFRQKFENVSDFEQRFATDARTAAQNAFNEPIVRESEFQAGHLTEEGAEHLRGAKVATPGQYQDKPGTFESKRPITDAEATAVFEHIEGETGQLDSPDDVKASLTALLKDAERQREKAKASFLTRTRGFVPKEEAPGVLQESTPVKAALSGYRTLVRELGKKFPNDTTEELINRLADNIYENHKTSKSLDEFVQRTVAQGTPEARPTLAGGPKPPTVPAEAAAERPAPAYEPGIKRPPFKPLYRAPRPMERGTYVPKPTFLSPIERMEMEAKAKAQSEYKPPTGEGASPELEQRGINISSHARGERPGGSQTGIFRFRKNVPRDTIAPEAAAEAPAAPAPEAPKPKIGQGMLRLEDGPAPGEPVGSYFKRVQDATKEQWQITADDIKDILVRGDARRKIPATLDGVENITGKLALDAKEKIVMASTGDMQPGRKFSVNPFSKMQREQRAANKEARLRRTAVIPIVAAGKVDKAGNWTANKSKLVDWRAKLDIAEARAKAWSKDLNPVKAREGRKDLAYVKEMQAAVDYADKHWGEPIMRQTVETYRQEVHDQIEFEKLHGATTVERDNYIPGLMQATSFKGKRLLGTKYKLPKTFNNPYEAIKAGPYRLASADVADLAHSRITTGRRAVEQNLWAESLKGMTDPASGKPIAKSPAQIPKKVVDPATGLNTTEYVWDMPSKEYEPVYVGRNPKPLAIHQDFAPLVQRLVRPDIIADFPAGKAALKYNQILKHGVLLILDTFHLGRVGQYGAALMGYKGAGWRGGASALNYRFNDLDTAVKKGFIPQAAAEWAKGEVELNVPGGKIKVTRHALAQELLRNGLNASKITDALFKDAVENIPLIGKPYHRLISPYNKFLFDRFLPGIMLESAVRNLEKYNKTHPNVPLEKMAQDVIRDINVAYGNMGRQGIFQSATFRSLAQLVMLAPMWQEGLVRKELSTYSRVAALPFRGAAKLLGKELPYRKGMPALGPVGDMMVKGMASYFILNQLINLYTRGHFTWKNEEEGHKMDAFLPVGENGVWLSPTATFGETLHDYTRLAETKPKMWDRLTKMGSNRLAPWGKAAVILGTGESPTGEKYSTTSGRTLGALSQVTPFAGATPIAFGTPARALGSKIAPSYIAPNPPGAVARQAASTLAGVKLQPGQTKVNQVFRLADEFMQQEGLKKQTGWEQIMTDDPSYTMLRRELRGGDVGGAKSTLEEIRKSHTDQEIIKAMKLWAKSEFTKGTKQQEQYFLSSLTDKQLDLYTAANEERQDLLEKFYDFISDH